MIDDHDSKEILRRSGPLGLEMIAMIDNWVLSQKNSGDEIVDLIFFAQCAALTAVAYTICLHQSPTVRVDELGHVHDTLNELVARCDFKTRPDLIEEFSRKNWQ